MGSPPPPGPAISGIRSLSLPCFTPVVPSSRTAISGCVVRIDAAGNRSSPPTSSQLREIFASRFTRSDLLDLTEFKFYRRRAAKDRHCDLHARTRLIDLFDHTREGGERT